MPESRLSTDISTSSDFEEQSRSNAQGVASIPITEQQHHRNWFSWPTNRPLFSSTSRLSTLEPSNRSWSEFWKLFKGFLGPGFLISVGYLDPGNWATDLAAGSQFGYRLLFIILMSSLMAMLLQSLCVRLGVVTGLDLAQCCRKHFSKPVALFLYVLCEIAIMATDLAEVIGAAIALKLLFNIPLLWGVLLTGLDVLVILAFGFNAKHIRVFEIGIGCLVFVTAVCLFIVAGKSGPVFRDVLIGYLPTLEIFTAPGSLAIAVGIIGATVMPHNLYLHSYIVKYRSKSDQGSIEEIDTFVMEPTESTGDPTQPLTRKSTLPSTLQMSYLDSIVALTFALFVNSSILIISSANFYTRGLNDVAEIPDAFQLIGESLGSSFSTLFAVALLLAAQSSTITGTMAGQIVMDGFLGAAFQVKPWVRRLITRVFAIGPAIITILVFGSESLNNLLIISQIVLSAQLPFAVWPLVYFTSRKDLMTVTLQDTSTREANRDSSDSLASMTPHQDTEEGPSFEMVPSSCCEDSEMQTKVSGGKKVDFSNSMTINLFAILVASLLTIFNIALLVEFARGHE